NEPWVEREKNQRNACVARRHISVLGKIQIVDRIPSVPDLKPAAVTWSQRNHGLHAKGQNEDLDSKNQPDGGPIPLADTRQPIIEAASATGRRRSLARQSAHLPLK